MSLYDTLHVTPNATPDVIQSAYRALARTYHPDLNPTAEAAARMQEINAAYAVLMDPERRARYDARRARQDRVRRNDRAGGRGVAEPEPATPHVSPEATPVAGAISSSEPTPLFTRGCPRIGFRDDPESRFRKPTKLHACFASGRAASVSIHEQGLYCLQSTFVHCPRWIASVSTGPATRSAATGDPGRGASSAKDRQPRMTASRPAHVPSSEIERSIGAYRWSSSNTALKSWTVFAAIILSLVLALIVTLTLTLALVVDALDNRDYSRLASPGKSGSQIESSQPGASAAHPTDDLPTVLPWACAFWQTGRGQFC